MSQIYSYSESLPFSHYAKLFNELGLEEHGFTTLRKLISAIKSSPPALIVAEFRYAWGNNYASCHIGNLDTLLIALPKYAPDTRVIVIYHKGEREYVEQLRSTYIIHGMVEYSPSTSILEECLTVESESNGTADT